jgi:outer membrane protein assembly factor BamB
MESFFRQSVMKGRARLLRALVIACSVLFCVSWHSACALQNGDDVRQRELLKMVSDAEQSLAERQWLQAVEQFDAAWAMACEREDPLLTASGADVNQLKPGETQQLAGGRARLEDLFLTAPDAFTAEYRTQFENLAESRISEAVTAGDFQTLRRLTLRYAFCPAAQNGLRILTRQSIDRGDDLEAALLLNRILRVRGRQTNNAESTALSLQIAVCNWRAGLYADALESMQALMAVDQERVAWQGLMPPASASTQDLQNWFATFTGIAGANPSEWTQPGGDYRRWASRSRGPARLEQAWVSDSLTVQDVLYADRLNPILQSLRNPLLALNDAQGQENSIVIPAATPLRVGDLVIFRAPWGIRAVNAVDGETVWEVARPNGRILDALQKAEELSVEPVSPAVSESPDSETQVALQSNAELQAITIPLIVAPSLREQMVRTNTTAQLAASASTLFVCENASGTASDNQNQMSFRGTQNEQSASNFVRAYDLKSGLFKWEVGGQTQSAAQPKGKGNQLAGFYFLGTPVILGNRVYVLAQSSEGIFLLQIAEPSASDSGVTNPRIVRSQLLTQPQFSASEHPVRKHAGLVPSYAHGLLICPTCDERIVAVSADDNAVRWVFRYAGLIRRQELGGDFPVLSGSRDIRDSGRVDLDARWTDSLPRIVGDKVLVTPRDSDKLYCLDLRSGKERWEMDRGQFHSIAAIIDDSLILCGNSVVQAFQVDDGKPLWSQSITTGIVCGRPAADQHLLHIPTSEPAIVTIDMQTGRRLASRYLLVDEQEQSEFGDMRAPGNLLIIDNQVLSQDLESLRAYTQGIEELPPVDLATERLLQGDRPGAIALLEKGMDDSSNRSAARNVLIDVLMESLREDFAANQALVGRIRELIQQAEEARPLASVLHLMLGMSLQDIALLPDQLHSRSQRQLSELTRLVAQGLSASQTISLQDLAERMRVMLPEMISGQKEDIAIGQLRHLKSLTFASGIRNALNQRSQQDRIELQNQLREACISALTKTSDRNSQLQFARDVASSGMPQLALHVLQFIIAGKNDAAGELIQQQIQLDVMRAGSDDGTSAKSLLDHCEAMDDLSMIQAIHTEILNPDIANPFNDQRIVTAAAMANRTAFEEWFSEHADSVATEASGWGLTAEIAQSDHRTVMPPQTLPHDIPNVAIPLFGSPGKFRGWSFVVLWKEQKVAAYDIDGRIRWTLPVSGAGEELGDRRRSETYLTASGNLLLLNLNGGIFSLDTSQLTQRTEGDEQVLEPKVLWMRQLADPDADEYRSYSEAEERIIQFAPQLSGYYPVAPLTPLAVALVAGRRLLVYDTLAGHLMWQLDEIPRDTVLLTTREAVLILSEDSRQIESRSLLDGTLLQVSGLPEWWGDANSNAGSSVADDDIEPGEEKLWRIAVLGQSCVLFRLGASKSSLECRDLTTDALTWSVDLPAHSVFSNVANDVVATLSDEHELKLIRIDTGHVLASLDVAPVPKPRDLFLMQSLGNFIVLPEGVDDPSIDLDPVIDAMHVYGRIYCVDGQSMKLRWDEPIDHRYIRLASAQKRVILPNSPILVLLNRGGPADPATGIRRVRHGVKLIDVRTGKELFNQNDVGMGLNDFWLRIDGQKHQLELSFESHILKLDFSDEQLDEKP